MWSSSLNAVSLNLLRALLKAPVVKSCLANDRGSFLKKKRSNSALMERCDVLRRISIRLGKLSALRRVKSVSETRCLSMNVLHL